MIFFLCLAYVCSISMSFNIIFLKYCQFFEIKVLIKYKYTYINNKILVYMKKGYQSICPAESVLNSKKMKAFSYNITTVTAAAITFVKCHFVQTRLVSYQLRYCFKQLYSQRNHSTKNFSLCGLV